MNTGTQIRLEACAKIFPGGTKALRPTSLEVAPGEILGLLGPSGCGKTTMLRIVAGLETSDPGGRVLFNGSDVSPIPIERRGVGIVFQSYALFPNMTVRGNVGYGLKVQGVSRAEADARLDEVLDLCQLTPFANQSVTTLSGGQRQRVALARAVAPRPKVLLLDEPLSALDAALRDRLRSELALLLRRLNTTAIFVTHDQAEAMAIADRIAVMEGGRVLQIDRPESLYAAPSSSFVAEFVGGANRLDGRGGDIDLELSGGRIKLPRSLKPSEAVYVRPEAVKVISPDNATVRGRVHGVIFQGTHHRLTIEGVAERPVIADHAGTQPPGYGDVVGIHIEVKDLMILPETEQLSE